MQNTDPRPEAARTEKYTIGQKYPKRNVVATPARTLDTEYTRQNNPKQYPFQDCFPCCSQSVCMQLPWAIQRKQAENPEREAPKMIRGQTNQAKCTKLTMIQVDNLKEQQERDRMMSHLGLYLCPQQGAISPPITQKKELMKIVQRPRSLYPNCLRRTDMMVLADVVEVNINMNPNARWIVFLVISSIDSNLIDKQFQEGQLAIPVICQSIQISNLNICYSLPYHQLPRSHMYQQEYTNPYFYYLGESIRRLATIKDIDDNEERNQNQFGFTIVQDHTIIKEEGEDKKISDRLRQMMDGTNRIIQELQEMEYSFMRMKNMQSMEIEE